MCCGTSITYPLRMLSAYFMTNAMIRPSIEMQATAKYAAASNPRKASAPSVLSAHTACQQTEEDAARKAARQHTV